MGLTGRRAASTVEYALVLVAVLLLAAGSFKLLGGKVGSRSGSAGDVVSGEGNGKSGGGGGSVGGGGGAGGGGGGRSSVASKVGVGSVGAGVDTGGGGGSSRDTSSEQNAVASANNKDSGGNADVTEGFGAKRWMGIGLLAAGVLALGYVVGTMRRAKKAADDAGPGKDGSVAPRRSRKK